MWGKGVVLKESGYNYGLADLHAADDGSVIVSWIRDHGFGSNRYIYANKLSAQGQLLWGKKHVKVFDNGSLQFGNFPYFVPDGNGWRRVRLVHQQPVSTMLCAAYSRQWQRGLSPQRLGSLN